MPLPVCHTTGFLLHFNLTSASDVSLERSTCFTCREVSQSPNFWREKTWLTFLKFHARASTSDASQRRNQELLERTFRKSICSPLHALSVPFSSRAFSYTLFRAFLHTQRHAFPLVSRWGLSYVPCAFTVGTPPMCVPLRSLWGPSYISRAFTVGSPISF